MRALRQLAYGIPPVLVDDATVPVPKADEVLVRVRAAGLNAADWLTSTGMPYIGRLAFGIRVPSPSIQGKDLAGTVEAVGTSVTGFKLGDEVYAENAATAFAEYSCVPARFLALKPRNLSFAQAAVVPLSGNTALQGLRELADVRPGQRVLVNGASGGVGSFAVQIAKSMGAHVTGVCSTRNLAFVRSLGADAAVDYTTTDFTATGETYDVIFDLVGNHSLRDCRRALVPKGILVLSSGSGSRLFGPIGRLLRASASAPFISQRLKPLAAVRSAARLDGLRELIESGAVTPQIERTMAFDKLPEAIAYLGTGRVRGKIAIVLHDEPSSA
jgi:NADPH:quinone reductase-like Zn-dependent oxidoreductase